MFHWTIERVGAVAIALLLLVVAPVHSQDESGDGADVLGELTEALQLSEEQSQQVGGLLQKFATDMDAATAQAEGEDPDNQKIIGDIKKARNDFNKGMEKTLTKEQWQQYQAMVDQVFQETFEDIAEIRIMDLEPILDLTEDQAVALKPVMGTAIRNMVATLFEYGDKKLNTRTKIKLGKSLKRIQSDMNKGMEAILSPEQMQKYQAYTESQKS